jgi:YVTN family beta-propeller protein
MLNARSPLGARAGFIGRAVATLVGCAATAPTADAAAQATAVPHGQLIVANQQSGDVSIVALPGGAERRVPVGAGPHEAAIAPNSAWGIATVYGTRDSVGTRLALVDLATGALLRHVDLGQYTRPHAVVALPGTGRRALVTSETTKNVLIVDLDAGRVEAVIPTEAPGSHMVAVTADGRRAFTANVPTGSISELDLTTGAFVRTIAVGQQATEGIAVTPDGREVWIGSNASGIVSVVDTREGKVVATVTGFRVPYRLAIAADGRSAAVVDPETGSLHLVDVAARRITASVALGASPRGVVFAPDGRTAFATVVAADGAGSAVAVDVGAARITGRFAVGTAPDGLAFRPGGATR